MASQKYRGIIVESKDSKEKDKIVSIYTLESGLIRTVFRGVRGEKAKMKASKEVFTFGDFFIENTKGNNVVSAVDVIEAFYPVRENLEKYYEACSVIDAAKKIITAQAEPALFIEIVKAMKFICYENLKKNYVLCKYLLNIFKGAGYPLNMSKCSSCGAEITGKKYFNYEIGETLCGNCRTYTSEELSPAVVNTLRIINNIDYEKLSTVHLSDDSIKGALQVLAKNFQFRFGKEIFVVF